MSLIAMIVGFGLWLGVGKRPNHEKARPRKETGLYQTDRSLLVRSAGMLIPVRWRLRQLGPVVRRQLPAGSSHQGIPQQAVHEPGHRDAVTPGFMVERRDHGPRNDGHVMGRLCHQLYMPQVKGILRWTELGGSSAKSALPTDEPTLQRVVGIPLTKNTILFS
jgi:hypothetical protein